MKKDNQNNIIRKEENIPTLIMKKEKSASSNTDSSFFASLSGTRTESISINENINKEYEKDNYIKKLLNRIINYNEQNKDKNLIFDCPNKNCPFIPFIKYFEFTQSVSTKCRMGHEYHLSLMNYFELAFKKINTEKFCTICLKKNYSNIKNASEFFCTKCLSYLCQKCENIHNQNHQIMEINKVNTFCPLHILEKTKFSGFCTNCQKDLCIHCLKDHSGEHHYLIKYLELIPTKDKINNYKTQIEKEIQYIDKVKNILFENRIIENINEIKIFSEFCDIMKLKYYFYEAQLKTFDKIRYNINIIKNVVDLFLISQNFFQNMNDFIQKNVNEYNKTQISNKIISTVLKYHNNNNQKKSIKKCSNPIDKYKSHFEFKPLFSLNKNKNIKFIYMLKCGKILVCVENDGLYLYDDGTFVEILHIISETEIIDLCQDDSGLIFLLKKSMIEIIQIDENYNGYISKNKILFKSIDKVNFICTLYNRTIVVSRVKRNEGNLEIWMKSNIINKDNNINNQNNSSRDKKTKNKTFPELQERGRNFIDMFRNNNRRFEIVLRRRINNNNVQNNNNIVNNNNGTNNNIITNNNNGNNNINNDEDDDNNENNNNNQNNINRDNNNLNNNNNDNNNNENNDNNNDDNNNNLNNNNNNENNNNEINTNNNINENNNLELNNNYNDNIILEEIPHRFNNLQNAENNNNNLNNLNNINNNIIINNNLNNNNFNIQTNHININNNLNNNINNNNNNNIINITRLNRGRNRRANQDNQRPRFVHVIHFIRDQLQGLVNNLEQEELVLEDPFLISSAGIYGPKDPEITHLNKVIKKGHEICALLEWDENFFICSEFHAQMKNFKCIRIYSSETYEPIGFNGKIKIKNCSRDKNALVKIDNEMFAVCYDIEKNIYGISLVCFKTREEICQIEMPKFNFVKKIYFNKCNYLFVLLDYLGNKNINQDMIKVFKIVDKELVDSSSYFFDSWLNTYVYNKENEKILEGKKIEKNDDDNKDDNINMDNILEEEKNKDKELKFFNIINSFEQNNHYGNEIVSMIKLKNNTLACLNKSHYINFYKID